LTNAPAQNWWAVAHIRSRVAHKAYTTGPSAAFERCFAGGSILVLRWGLVFTAEHAEIAEFSDSSRRYRRTQQCKSEPSSTSTQSRETISLHTACGKCQKFKVWDNYGAACATTTFSRLLAATATEVATTDLAHQCTGPQSAGHSPGCSGAAPGASAPQPRVPGPAGGRGRPPETQTRVPG